MSASASVGVLGACGDAFRGGTAATFRASRYFRGCCLGEEGRRKEEGGGDGESGGGGVRGESR